MKIKFRWLLAHKEFWGVPLGLLILTVLPLADLLWLPPGQYMGGSSQGNDFTSSMSLWWRFALGSLRSGEFPLWNPYAASGLSFIANPQPALFYPPVWLIGVLPLPLAIGILFTLHLWLAALGMYVWLRSEEASQGGAWFGAVVFAFSGYFLVRISAGHSDVLMTQVWLPWVLWACRRAMARRHWTRAFLAGVPLGLSLLGGNIASFLYPGIVLAAYVLYTVWTDGHRTVASCFKALLPVAAMGAIGFALAAVQFIPTFQFLSLSTREDASYAFSSGYSWPPSYLITLLVPNFFGNPVTTGYWGDGLYEEVIFYTAILPLALVLLAGNRLRHRLKPLLLILAGAGLLLALGRFGIVHRVACTLFPLFSTGRAPARAGFLFAFSVAALGGLLVTQIERDPTKVFEGIRWKIVAYVVGAIAAQVILASLILFALQRESNPEIGRLWHVANNVALCLLFLLLTAALLKGWSSGRLASVRGVVLAVGLVLLDLWSFGRPLLQAVPISEGDYWPDVAAIVGDTDDRILPWGLGVFEQNLNMPLGLYSVFSYDSMEVDRYHRFITSMPDLRARAYDLLRTRYLVSEHEMDFPDDVASPLLIGQQGRVWVYERPRALPAAWLVHQAEVYGDENALLARLNDPAFSPLQVALVEQPLPCALDPADEPADVQIVRRENNTILLEVDAPADGLLVLSELSYPGWRVSVDGERAPIVRANYTLRAVCVPRGNHRVTFSFLPGSLIAGAVITGVALLTVVVAAFSWLVELRRHSGAAARDARDQGVLE